jgi:predicted regulator of Ras-like GTPase activity (Roadblock/LC7/MglB family)
VFCLLSLHRYPEECVFNQILEKLIASVNGTRAVIFLDGEGESIAQAGDNGVDMRLLGAWKEIHLDHIRDIANRLGLGQIHAVLFSLDEGNELIVPVSGEYCLLLFLSSYAHVQDAMAGVKKTVELLKKEVEG